MIKENAPTDKKLLTPSVISGFERHLYSSLVASKKVTASLLSQDHRLVLNYEKLEPQRLAEVLDVRPLFFASDKQVILNNGLLDEYQDNNRLVTLFYEFTFQSDEHMTQFLRKQLDFSPF